MKAILKLAGLLALVVAAVIAAATWLYLRTPTDFERRLSAVERQAERIVHREHAPGVMWAVVAPGEIIASGATGYADVSSERLMTPETIMPIGSISKVLVGLAGAIAQGDGLMDLEAPLEDYLSVPFDPPGGEPRTFTDLATHTAGILDTDEGYEAVGYHYGSTRHPIALSVFLARYLGNQGDLHSAANFGDWLPGTRYVYSNVGAGLAGQAIADATGQPFDTYSTMNVVEPLKLSGFWGQVGPDPSSNISQATLYDRDANGAFVPLPAYGLATWPDGQFNASAQDLAKLMATLLNEGQWGGEQVLPSEAVALQQKPRVSNVPGKDLPGDHIGLFWERETLELGPLKLTLDGHSGGDPGVVTFMYRVPDNPTAFVLMFNGEPENTLGLLSFVRMIRLLAGMPLPQ